MNKKSQVKKLSVVLIFVLIFFAGLIIAGNFETTDESGTNRWSNGTLYDLKVTSDNENLTLNATSPGENIVLPLNQSGYNCADYTTKKLLVIGTYGGDDCGSEWNATALTDGVYPNNKGWMVALTENAWIVYNFTTPRYIRQFNFAPGSSFATANGREPNRTYFQGSNDYSTWTDLTEVISCPYNNDGVMQHYNVTKNYGAYIYYRVFMMDNWGGNGISASEIELVEGYPEEGSYLSEVFDAGEEVRWDSLDAGVYNTTQKQNISFQVRSCDDDACSGESFGSWFYSVQ